MVEMSKDRAIIMVTNAVAPDKLGGLERYVRELSAQLVRVGQSVTVLTKQVSAEDALDEIGEDGVRIVRHRVPSKSKPTFALQYPFSVFQGVRHGVRDHGVDAIVHGHFAVSSLPLALSRRPFIQTFHAPVHKEILAERGNSYALPKPVQRLAVGSVRAAEQLVFRRSRRNIVLSKFMSEELEALLPAAGKRTSVIAGGIDVEWFSPGDVSRDPWAEAANPLFFCARRLTTRTGVPELVHAMQRVVAQLPNAQLAIAGDGHQRAQVEALIDELRLTQNVQLLGRISDTALRDWYRMADLVVTPTQELEGFGLSTAEAMACGTPCLVTPVGANAELTSVLDERLVASGKTSVDLAERMVELTRNLNELDALGARAREVVERRWSWGAVVDAHLAMYEEFNHGVS
jgi:glycosyltransferase involved in cell wall biosynthesis